jgi:hypothetical protein
MAGVEEIQCLNRVSVSARQEDIKTWISAMITDPHTLKPYPKIGGTWGATHICDCMDFNFPLVKKSVFFS